jgi:hypothetical protein
MSKEGSAISVEDRVKTAAEATAASVRHIRPLALPEYSAAPDQLRGHGGHRRPRAGGTLRKIKETWIVPLGAAAAVAVLALALVIVRHAEAPQTTPANSGGAAPVVSGIPQYYAVATQGPVSHDGKAVISVTVGNVYTGKTLATVALPAVNTQTGGNVAVGVSATGDDRAFVVGTRNIYGGIAYYLVHIAPGTKQVATVQHIPIPQTAVGVLLGFAVSPDGKELAAMSVRGNGTTLAVYSVSSGATLRTWTAATWKTTYSEYQEGVNVSWTADNRQVAFATVVTTGQSHLASGLDERIIGVTEPSGDLATASKVVLAAPGNCSSLLLTPDGGTVVCATQINPLGGGGSAMDCGGKNGPMFIAYSTATGKRLRVLYQYTGSCDSAVDTVLWSDAAAKHVIGESQTTFLGTPPQSTNRYGVAAAGEFVKFPVPRLGESYSGPAF